MLDSPGPIMALVHLARQESATESEAASALLAAGVFLLTDSLGAHEALLAAGAVIADAASEWKTRHAN